MMRTLFFTVLALGVMADLAEAKDLQSFQPKFMIPGYCQAGSRKDDKALGGYGPSDNAPKQITAKMPGAEGQIALVALPADSVPFSGQYRGFRLLLVNRTAKEAAFAACDSRLNIICEARDANGDWKPIESFPSSYCGNSYHNAYLLSGHYWEFAAPAYSGSFDTKLRFQLRGEKTIYSNEFDGSINPVQFNQLELPK